MTEEMIQQADVHLAAPSGQGFAASRGEAAGDRTAAPTQPETPSQALNGIPATWTHDEGAYAQCGECGRYSVDPFTLSARPRACECGSKHGWSGSFKRPGPDAKWSGQAPERDAAGVPRGEWGGLSPKQAWWAGYRVGKGLPPDMPRSEAVAADPCWYAECGAPTGQSRTSEAPARAIPADLSLDAFNSLCAQLCIKPWGIGSRRTDAYTLAIAVWKAAQSCASAASEDKPRPVLLPDSLRERIDAALECALLWTEGAEAHPRIERTLADLRALAASVAPTEQSQTFEAGEATCASNEPDEQKEAEHRCPTCNGNDADAPCAYPGEGMPGCPRDVRLTSSVSQGMAQDAARYRFLRSIGHAQLEVFAHYADEELDKRIDAALLPLPQPTGERNGER